MVEQHAPMKLTSISLIAGGLMLAATTVIAVNTITTGPSTGIGELGFSVARLAAGDICNAGFHAERLSRGIGET
jgi:hypothetical protein